MKKTIQIYKAFTKAGIQDMVAYRGSFFGFFIGELFYCFVMFFIWKAVFISSNSDTFMGFSMIDMTVYLFLTNITLFLTGTDSAISIGEEIRDGSIIMRMIKPIKVDFSILFFELGNKIIIVFCVFIPLILGLEIYKYIVIGKVAFHISYFLVYLLSVSLSYILAFYLNLAFGYLAFFLMNLWGFNILKESLLKFFSGAIIPIAFMPLWAQTVLNILPFASLSYTPVMIYMGKYQGVELLRVIGIQLLWVVLFVIICQKIWKLAERYLCIQGG